MRIIMLGAIIGDIVGSKYEFNNTLDYDFSVFLQGWKKVLGYLTEEMKEIYKQFEGKMNWWAENKNEQWKFSLLI